MSISLEKTTLSTVSGDEAVVPRRRSAFAKAKLHSMPRALSTLTLAAPSSSVAQTSLRAMRNALRARTIKSGCVFNRRVVFTLNLCS